MACCVCSVERYHSSSSGEHSWLAVFVWCICSKVKRLGECDSLQVTSECFWFLYQLTHLWCLGLLEVGGE